MRTSEVKDVEDARKKQVAVPVAVVNGRTERWPDGRKVRRKDRRTDIRRLPLQETSSAAQKGLKKKSPLLWPWSETSFVQCETALV